MVDLLLAVSHSSKRKIREGNRFYIKCQKYHISDFLKSSVQNQKAAVDLQGIDVQVRWQCGPWAQGREAGALDPFQLCEGLLVKMAALIGAGPAATRGGQAQGTGSWGPSACHPPQTHGAWKR